MPICYKCGKSLSSEQALTYHMNRKYKCGTWKCAQCNLSFSTKFDMNIHLLHCEQFKSHHPMPSADVLSDLFQNIPLSILVVNDNNIVSYFTPYTKTKYPHALSIVGKPIDTISNVQKISSQFYMVK